MRHIGDARSPEPAPLGLACLEEIAAVEEHDTRANAAAGPRVAHGGKPDRRFAGPQFSDQAEYPAATQVEIDPFDNLVPAVLAAPVDP